MPREGTRKETSSVANANPMGASWQTRSGGEDAKPIKRVKPKLFRKFQVEKSAALGLLIPQNLRLDVRHVDVADQDLGPAFQTSSMNWTQLFVKYPPSFQLHTAMDDTIVGLEHQTEESVAKLITPCWNKILATIAKVEIFRVNEWFQYGHDLPADIWKKWTVRREGWARHYTVNSTNDEEKSGLQGQRLT